MENPNIVSWKILHFDYGERVIVPCFDEWVKEIVPIGLALIVYKLVSVLTSIADEIMPIGLALIVHKLVSGFWHW